jgi:uncharacterized membrane protein YidH (DUF202 family)
MGYLIGAGFIIVIGGGYAIMPAARRFDRRRAVARESAGKPPVSRWWIVAIGVVLLAISAVLDFGHW